MWFQSGTPEQCLPLDKGNIDIIQTLLVFCQNARWKCRFIIFACVPNFSVNVHESRNWNENGIFNWSHDEIKMLMLIDKCEFWLEIWHDSSVLFNLKGLGFNLEASVNKGILCSDFPKTLSLWVIYWHQSEIDTIFNANNKSYYTDHGSY